MSTNGLRRSGRLAAMLLVLAAFATVAPADEARKVFVLGIDGFDPKLMERFIADGDLPNFERLAREGDFHPLQTTMPPLSPVAWSTFITGMDPAGHGIFDFVHRDTQTILPYLSMARTGPPGRNIALGSFVMPIGSPLIENLRRGTAFWEILEDNGVPTTIFRMPANFPPVDAGGKSLSGMGTPDIRGTPGTFSFYTDHEVPDAREITGGDVFYVNVEDGRVDAKLHGPPTPFWRVPSKRRSSTDEVRYTNPEMTADFTVWLDPESPTAMIEVEDQEVVLQEGEWSPWVRIDFTALRLKAPGSELQVPLVTVSSIGRFYLKQVRPEFELYVSPLQISPENPAMPISTPESWAHELYENLGFFYTQELPEDTKALSAGILTPEEFWDQLEFVYAEENRALDYMLEHFEEGFLFFYISAIDQGSHMLWGYTDPRFPGYVDHPVLKDGIRTLYRQADDALGRVMASLDDETTLIVMSDHGFGPFYRGVNLNTWLLEKGYVTLKDPAAQGRSKIPFVNVDWSRTRAYAVGLNGIYVNLEGREKNGIVKPGAEYERVLEELERDLLALADPETGRQVVTLVTRTGVAAEHDVEEETGPDLVVGYTEGYRSSWTSPVGEFPRGIFVDNDDPWSGDHSVDYREVPGVLLSNRRITLDQPALADLTVAVLDEYGIPKPPQMVGQDCLGAPTSDAADTNDTP
jgi:predicted AlkP superfamily phosphohydrolase/phosphomutase